MDNNYFIFVFVAQCLLLGALAVRPSPYRWMFFPFTAGLNLYCYFLNPTDDKYTNEALRCAVTSSIAAASDYILLTDVQHELRRVGQRDSISNAGLKARLQWACQLFTGARGVGWTHEPTKVLPPHPKLTRFQFIASRLGLVATCLLINDVSSTLIRANPFFAKDAPPFAEQPLLWRFAGALLFGVVASVNITISHTWYSIVVVGSGLSQPDTWPHIMGKWSDAYTIRRFWGRTWHQTLRRVCSVHGKFLAHRLFKLRPGSYLSLYVKLYSAFLISGLIHVPPTNPGALHFFLLQAVAITFEEVVIALAARAGMKHSNVLLRYMGYVWVYCWFVYSLGPWIDFHVSSGAFEHGGMKFSLIMGLYRGKWSAER